MFKIFSNTIPSYLEKDLNNFIKTTNCLVVNIHYTTSVFEEEIIHNVLLHYIIPIE